MGSEGLGARGGCCKRAVGVGEWFVGCEKRGGNGEQGGVESEDHEVRSRERDAGTASEKRRSLKLKAGSGARNRERGVESEELNVVSEKGELDAETGEPAVEIGKRRARNGVGSQDSEE